mmetsp:Transcript_14117/g.20871  ORF Transcript_14117/g.20871 Transcript_14117/m.20871 type:complete len:272 (-) Transcript_14117:106-921(-)
MRKSAFDYPLSNDQVASTIVYLLMSTFFCVIAVFSLDAFYLKIVFPIYVAMQALFLGLWIYLEFEDPSNVGGYEFTRKRSRNCERYCPSCRKAIVGFDHHCTWLNTCIGKRNYLQFYLLSVVGSVMFASQAIVGLLVIFLGGRCMWDKGVIVWGVHVALSFAIFSAFLSLSGFHTFLIIIGKGTYDYIMDEQKVRETRRKQKMTSLQPRGELTKSARVTTAEVEDNSVAKGREMFETGKIERFSEQCKNRCKTTLSGERLIEDYNSASISV